jgi:hypothetical protein
MSQLPFKNRNFFILYKLKKIVLKPSERKDLRCVFMGTLRIGDIVKILAQAGINK